MFIDKIGIELEGLWEDEPPDCEVYGDGSVCDFGRDEDDDSHIGEISSKPVPLPEALAFINMNYPDETNSTCGFHIHFSFKDKLSYSVCMEKKFQAYFLRQMAIMGEEFSINKNSAFWERLRGSYHYCRKEWKPDKQAKCPSKTGERYTQINFCYNCEGRGTLEIRLLPCFQKKELSIKCLTRIYEVFETYIAIERTRRERDIIVRVPDIILGEEELTICV